MHLLYWLKKNAIATRKELSEKLGRDQSTVYRWLKRYEKGGIEALLEVQTPPGKLSLIPPEIMNQLQEWLKEPQGFKSYRQIQNWLNQEYQVVIAYKTVHKIVRYKLNAKLKVPRPQSSSSKPEVQQIFKKNFQTL